MHKQDPLVQQAHAAAIEAFGHAYAPYSNYIVGSAVITEDNDIFAGCNVENQVYGATICAERNAIFHAVASKGKTKLIALVLVTDADPLGVPCGMCLQVTSEFCEPSMPVFIANKKEIVREYVFSDLLPQRYQLV